MKKLSALLCLLGWLVPSVTEAQLATTEIAEVKVDFWPEYDRPAVLVLYRIRLLEGTDLSVPVAIPIPAAVGEPHAVAWRDDKGGLLLAQYTRRVEGDRAMLLAHLGSLEGQLEFYTDLAFDGRKRTFRFTWPGGVDVGSLSFQVQQPRGATALHIEPPPARDWQGEDGLGYALVELGRRAPSEEPVVEVSYEKDSSALTAGEAKRSPAPSLPTGSTSAAPEITDAGPATKLQSLPWWLIGLGGIVLGLLGAGAVALALRRREEEAEEPPPPVEQRKKNRKKKGSAKSDSAPGVLYCHECGTKGRKTDTFCMNCGTKLLHPES